MGQGRERDAIDYSIHMYLIHLISGFGEKEIRLDINGICICTFEKN